MDYTGYVNLEFLRVPESIPQADRGRVVVDGDEDEQKKKSSDCGCGIKE